MPRVRHPRLLALSAAALFSTGGTAIKLCSFGPWQVASLRCAFAAAAIAAFVPESRRGFTWRVLPVAGAYAMQSVLFATSNKLTTASNAIFLQNTAPLYVLLFAPLLLREKARLRDVLTLAALGAGLALFFVGAEPRRETATDPLLGNVLAAASGLGWALTVIGLRWLGRAEADAGPAALQATLFGNVLACLVALPWALPLGEGSATDWAVVAYLGVVQIGLAYLCLARAARDLPAMGLALLLLLEPVLSTVWAWLVHAERPTAWSAAGAATILGATLLSALRR